MMDVDLPQLSVAPSELVDYIAKNEDTPIQQLLQPFRDFESRLREKYAQDGSDPVLNDPYINVLPVFAENTPGIRTRARDLANESVEEKERYIMELPDAHRRPNGSPAVVQSLQEFRHNFSVFSEASLSELDWSNVVAAGSSVVNCLLPLPDDAKASKRALRQYYHEKFCPASDVDLFLYGLSETQAVEKIKQIEARVRDAILTETTVVRTKNAITICSQYPTRHVQIVLRVYKSISEILAGFDVDCSCCLYDGNQVYCSPRALASFITQINPVDLSRRSPSYENRLSKYSHRNFEVYWSELNRSRVDPTIFERSFNRTLGLARLLVLERLPTTNAREQYMRKRRAERGRPQPGFRFPQRFMKGNIKDDHEDEVADWVDEDEVSNYHTFTIPYGPRFHARKIEKLCYTRDLLLNAEWNQPKEREVYLHRHPAFFGRVEDVITDCCGACPQPETPQEVEVAKEESETYVSGSVSFRTDDPGRQQIGSFHPLTDNDWTEMAYVGNTMRLCQAIVDDDLEHIEDWLSQEGADPNTRDYTGRTPLHLAVTSSTPRVVRCLVDHGARLVARLADGRTALHLAAARGDADMVRILLAKSAANEEEEENRQDARRKAISGILDSGSPQRQDANSPDDEEDNTSDGELIDSADSDDGVHSVTTGGSFVKVREPNKAEVDDDALPMDDDNASPDFYKIDVPSWDIKCSPLHFAILGGHIDVVQLLCQEFGADVLSPVKSGIQESAILTLVLALSLPAEEAIAMAKTLLNLGATCSQAEVNSVTAFHRYVQNGGVQLVDSLLASDKMGTKNAINHVVTGLFTVSPLVTAIAQGDLPLVLRLLEAGAKTNIDFETWLKGAKLLTPPFGIIPEHGRERFQTFTEQPLIYAIRSRQPIMAIDLLERGADPNTMTTQGHSVIVDEWQRTHKRGTAALDLVRQYLKTLDDETDFYGLQPDLKTWQPCRRHTITRQKPSGVPPGTSDFLRKFDEGTYQHWMVSTDIKKLVQVFEDESSAFERDTNEPSVRLGIQKKKEAIEELRSQLARVEDALVARGAKTFREQHPHIQDPPESPCIHTPGAQETKPYAYSFSFSDSPTQHYSSFRENPDLTEKRRAAYIDLFEAVWRGDLEKIKSLTLAPWGPEQREPPLKIAVSDTIGNNPFSLAFVRKHFEVAKAVLEIAQAQWTPKEKAEARYKMVTHDDDGDDDGGESDGSEALEGPRIYKEIVDGQHTIENIGHVSMQVNSHTRAFELLNCITNTSLLQGDGPVKLNLGSLLQVVVRANDDAGLQFLLDMEEAFMGQGRDLEDEESDVHYQVPELVFDEAIFCGRVGMLSEMIKRFGAGMPLVHLVDKDSSTEEEEAKPRYYQGLTVYGKKRSDWARKGRNVVAKPTGRPVSPLLTAALQGSLDSVEWFLSDTPKRQYLEFGESPTAREDPRLRRIMQSPGGFDRAVSKWLGLQHELVIHCAVMGRPGDETNRLIKYLIEACPSSLEAKSDTGYTPLYLAFLLGRVQFAKTLIDAGADQAVRDAEYNNLVHAAVTHPAPAEGLRELLDLLEPELRSELFVQRNHLGHGGDTPLHFWLKAAHLRPSGPYDVLGDRDEAAESERTTRSLAVLEVLLGFSGGRDLAVPSGSGDTCLHSAVRWQLPAHVKALLRRDPRLLHRENAVGRTPAEAARDQWVALMASPLGSIVPAGVERGWTDGYAEVLPREDVETFASKDPRGRPRVVEHVWEVAQAHMAQFPDQRRRLVSLNEANEVAKRLGESYAWRRYHTNSEPQAYESWEAEQRRLYGGYGSPGRQAAVDAQSEPDVVTAEYRKRGSWKAWQQYDVAPRRTPTLRPWEPPVYKLQRASRVFC